MTLARAKKPRNQTARNRNAYQFRTRNPAKEKVSSKEFDTEDVKIYSLRIPTAMFDKLKHEIGRETKASMRDMILTAISKHYGI
ncbi:hypothetical protein SYJ56_03265 [Algoriphagus sp. D3-2-R+10]|uniref:hypothetical protein n=1 Tax=Algoriphagus aurantiacus TaxID=3103948 RepID=UPI002B3B8A96|nr:hypothetical protein [Algoriphagus sp. D3-2-R+10]MEB2774307.1 hypothetical protein [Algoriphagus sp. D3-2-R+10]